MQLINCISPEIILKLKYKDELVPTFFPQKAFLSCTIDLFLNGPRVLQNLKDNNF